MHAPCVAETQVRVVDDEDGHQLLAIAGARPQHPVPAPVQV